jgi:Trypsin-like peptidase domain
MFKLVLVLVLLFSSCFAANNAVEKAGKASLHIAQVTLADNVRCSATAIGPQALLTATHCEQPSDFLFIRQVDNPLNITNRLRDGNDHTILLITGAMFENFVTVSLKDPLEVSEDVFTWGNPGQWHDIFQKGYIMGTLSGHPDTKLFSFAAYPGSSGSGVFNTAGELIAVISTTQHQEIDDGSPINIKAAGAFPLGFTQDQIDLARNFVTKAAE